MKKFVKPTCEVIECDFEDVILTSGNDNLSNNETEIDH